MRRNKEHYSGMSCSPESGNAFLFVLMGIVLFAALSFTVARSMQSQTAGTMSDREINLAASDIIAFGTGLTRGTDRVRRNGCSENDISFFLPGQADLSGYEQTPPSDDKCRVFVQRGGSISYRPIPEAWLDPANSNAWRGDMLIKGSNEIDGVGTTSGTASGSDLVMFVQGLQQELCVEINNDLSVTNPGGAPPVDSAQGGAIFTGTFSYSETIGDEGSSAGLSAQRAGCFLEDDATPEYTYYHVLLER